jgi:cohesin domain-containing protein
MTNILHRINFLPLVLIALTSTGWAAQDSSGSPATDAGASVVLGGGTGSPGEQVVVPIYLRPPDGIAVGAMQLEINFVSVNLKYEKVEPGVAADMGNVEVKGELKLGKNDKDVETSTLTVTATAPASGGDPKGIPAGLLAYITLQISDKGRPATIGLRTKLEATALGTGKKLDQLRAADSSVEVVAPGSAPSVGCFFFTH